MTQDEFFARLAAELAAHVGEPAYAELIDDLRAHFAEALRQGRPEAEIAAQLGDPAEIAAGFVGLLAEADPVSPPSPPPATAPADGPGPVALTVRLRGADVILRGGLVDRPQVTVLQGGRPVDDAVVTGIEVEDLDGAIRITQARVNWTSRLANLWSSLRVEVDLPARLDGGLDLRVEAGNVDARDIAAIGPAVIESRAGNLHLTACEAPAFRLDSHAGNIHLRQCHGDVTARGYCGNIHADDHHGPISAATSAGNIHVTTDRVDRPAHLETTSGNLHVTVTDLAAGLTAAVRSGNVDVTVDRVGANVTARTNSGNVTAALGEATRAWFRLKGATVKTEFGQPASPDGLPVVDLHAGMGNVRVRTL